MRPPESILFLLLGCALTSPASAFGHVITRENSVSRTQTICRSHAKERETVGLSTSSSPQSRRLFLTSVGAASVATLVARPHPVFADVSDGNALPQGAAQFVRVVKVKSDLALVAKRVSEHGSEIDKEEWNNIGDFLRKLYKAGDDMKSIATSSIYDPAKKKQALDDVTLLQKVAQAGDVVIDKQNPDAFLVICNKAASSIDDFFDLLRDVPDEI